MVVLLFVLLISGLVDFAVLLNVRLSVSSLSRQLARSASVGAPFAELADEATNSPFAGVTSDGFTGGPCCGANSAVFVDPHYYHCTGPAICYEVAPPDDPNPPPSGKAQAGDRVTVIVTAMGADVITPLVRPAFGCTDGTAKHCFQHITAQTTMFYEGP